jgi:hypothetical protein
MDRSPGKVCSTVRATWRGSCEESRTGAVVVCLVPARIDTRWWHDIVRHADETSHLNFESWTQAKQRKFAAA